MLIVLQERGFKTLIMLGDGATDLEVSNGMMLLAGRFHSCFAS